MNSDEEQFRQDAGTGELIPADAAERMIAESHARNEAALYRAADEVADECEGKSEDEIRAILRRKLGAVFSASRATATRTAAKLRR